MADTSELIRELKKPDAYPHAAGEVGFLQTHISLLFFAGERVYKVKKAVNLGFVDFTDVSRRRHFCEEEVRLNRRLAPWVYEGVRPIVRRPDGLAVGSGDEAGAGEVVDWAVEMRRLPEERMLSALLERGEIDNGTMNSLVALLAEFHDRCPTGEGVDEHGSPDAVAANTRENFEQLRPFAGGGAPLLTSRQLDFLERRGRNFLAARSGLLRRRVAEGRIREGHGDLHSGNICVTADGIVVYDCIEFSRRLRCGDVAADLAFLAMDLDYRSYPGFSQYLVKRYADVTGDGELRSLVGFYKGYRALVRGKVAALTAGDPAVGEERRSELRREGMRYLQLAAAYELPPALILTCGLPASGKSWIAERLAGPLRAAVLHSDVRRKVRVGLDPGARAPEAYGEGLYSPESKRATYDSLLQGALEGLRAGHSVVVDASFSRREYRAPFVDAAARLGLPYYLLHVRAPEDVTRRRLERRKTAADTSSDAGLEVYLAERSAFEEPTETPESHVVEVTSGSGPAEEHSGALVDRMIALAEAS